MATEQNASGAQVPCIPLLECPFCGSPCRTAKDGDGWPSIECTNRDCYATIVFQNAYAGEPLKGQRDYAHTIRLFNTRHSNHRSERPSTRSGDAMTTETTHARVGGTLNPLLARLVEYVNTVEEALMQTEVGRNAWPRYAHRLRDAGDALKRECANAALKSADEGGVS